MPPPFTHYLNTTRPIRFLPSLRCRVHGDAMADALHVHPDIRTSHYRLPGVVSSMQLAPVCEVLASRCTL